MFSFRKWHPYIGFCLHHVTKRRVAKHVGGIIWSRVLCRGLQTYLQWQWQQTPPFLLIPFKNEYMYSHYNSSKGKWNSRILCNNLLSFQNQLELLTLSCYVVKPYILISTAPHSPVLSPSVLVYGSRILWLKTRLVGFWRF